MTKFMTKFIDLLDGHNRFHETHWQKQRERWDALASGQSPKVMLISCSDSRVEPAQIFDSNPGEIFAIRNVAALVPAFQGDTGQHSVSAAVEFAVQFLKVEEIVVMGHSRCGGCQAALSQQMDGKVPGEGGLIANWITPLDDARSKVMAQHEESDSEAAQQAMEQEAVKLSLSNLRTFPFVQDKEARSAITLIGAWFPISEGRIHILNEQNMTFSPA